MEKWELAAFRPVRSRKDARARVVVCARASVGVFLAIWRAFTLWRVLRSCVRIRASDLLQLLELILSDHARQLRYAAAASASHVPGCARCSHACSRCFCARSCCFRVHGRATRTGAFAHAHSLGCFVHVCTRFSKSLPKRTSACSSIRGQQAAVWRPPRGWSPPRRAPALRLSELYRNCSGTVAEL